MSPGRHLLGLGPREGWLYFLPPGVLYEANGHLQMKIKNKANNPASDNCKAGLILMKSATYTYINQNDSLLLVFHVICSDGFGMIWPIVLLLTLPYFEEPLSSPRRAHKDIQLVQWDLKPIENALRLTPSPPESQEFSFNLNLKEDVVEGNVGVMTTSGV